MEMKQKKFQNSRFSKWPFFKIANSQKKIVKISWIGPWVKKQSKNTKNVFLACF
jgi:hypothetical protein